MLALPRELRPLELMRRYPRIANRLCEHWDDASASLPLLEDLVLDRRGGRMGFPRPVVLELQALQEHLQRAHDKSGADRAPGVGARAGLRQPTADVQAAAILQCLIHSFSANLLSGRAACVYDATARKTTVSNWYMERRCVSYKVGAYLCLAALGGCAGPSADGLSAGLTERNRGNATVRATVYVRTEL